MPNEIKKPEVNYYEEYGQAATMRNIVGSLLRFTKFGEFKAGQEAEIVPLGTKMVVHMPTLTVGFIKWQDNRPVEQVMGLISAGYKPPKRSDLGDTNQSQWEVDDDDKPRDPWQLSNYLILSNPKDDQLYTFATASKGGLAAIGELSQVYGKRIRQTPDEYPLIELALGSYMHPIRKYGEVRHPIFKIVGWVASAKYAPLVAGNTANQEAASTPKQPAPKALPPTKKKPPAKAQAKSKAPVEF